MIGNSALSLSEKPRKKCCNAGCGFESQSGHSNLPAIGICQCHTGTLVASATEYGWTCCSARVRNVNEVLAIPPCSILKSHTLTVASHNSPSPSIAAPAPSIPHIDWNALRSRLSKTYDASMGYPVNAQYDYSELYDFFRYNIINVGDSFDGSLYLTNTKDVERNVLGFFAQIWGSEFEHTWGYITQAGTEGNLQGLFVGREYARSLQIPLVFYTTKNSHYSIFKIAKLLSLELCLIDSLENGEMDYAHFDRELAKRTSMFAL
ncbi:hypothetical protein HDU91_005869, partial [Kappamyces sp. JEL0680]